MIHVHKALRLFLFRMSAALGKFDPALEPNLPEIKNDFDELALFLREYWSQKVAFLHSFLERKHPATVAALNFQREQSEVDWRVLEEEAARFFANMNRPDKLDWQRFYLQFNQYVTVLLIHLQYEELVALPLVRELGSDADLTKRTQQMFKSLSPEVAALSKKWCFLACNLSELKEMGYVP